MQVVIMSSKTVPKKVLIIQEGVKSADYSYTKVQLCKVSINQFIIYI